MVTNEKKAELERLAQEWEARVRQVVADEEQAEKQRRRDEWEARVRQYMEATEDSIAAGELAEYLEEESRG